MQSSRQTGKQSLPAERFAVATPARLHKQVSSRSTKCNADTNDSNKLGSRPATPAAGSTRRGTPRDVSKLAKIFGPSRYPAFQVNGSEDIPSPPQATATRAAPPLMQRPQLTQAQAEAAIEAAQRWADLEPLLAAGAGLGSDVLLLLAETLTLLVLQGGPRDAQETKKAVRMAQMLETATRVFVSGTYTPEQLNSLLRTMVVLGGQPSANWMFALELSCVPMMKGLRANQALRANDQQTSQTGVYSKQMHQELEQVKVLLQLCAWMHPVGHTPRDTWLQLLSELLQPMLSHMAAAADAYLTAEASQKSKNSALADLKKASKGGLIRMPEQIAEVDQVITADGETIDIEQPTTNVTNAGSQQWSDVPQFGPTEWVSISQLLSAWEMPVTETFLQAYINASYGALVASGKEIARELDEGEQEGQPMLAARALDSSALADIAASLLMAGARPSQRWTSALAAAASAVFTKITADQGTATTGFTAYPAAVNNLISVMRQCDYLPDQAWIETALLAVSEDQTRAPGDQLALLIYQTASLEFSLSNEAMKAVTALANRVGSLWEEQTQLEQRQRQPGQASADAQDVTGLTSQGLVMLMIGLAELGVLQQLPPKWIQAWGAHAARLAPEFEPEAVLASLTAAGSAGVILPARTIHVLAGQVLDKLHAAGEEQVSQQIGSTESANDTPESKAAQLVSLLGCLARQPVQLPSAWMTPLSDLIVYHIRIMENEQLVEALQVMGLIESRPEPSFVRTVLSTYQSAGGLSDPEGCLALSQALVAVGPQPEAMKDVEVAALQCFTSKAARPADWAGLLSAFSMGGHIPSLDMWQQLEAATLSSTSTLTLAELCEMLSAYGTMRYVTQSDLGGLGSDWADRLTGEAIARLSATTAQEELVALLGALGSLFRSWPPETCTVMETAAIRNSEELVPSAVTACAVMFSRSGYEPSTEWCNTAAKALTKKVSNADAQDLIAFINACAELPTLLAITSKGLLANIMEAAGKLAAANAMQPMELASFLSAAAKLQGSPAVLQSKPAVSSLLERALSMRELMSPSETCAVLEAVGSFGIRTSPRWMALMLARFGREQDIVQLQPDELATLANVIESSESEPPAGLLRCLAAALPSISNTCVEALQVLQDAQQGRSEYPAEMVQERLQEMVGSCIRLLHSVVNIQTGVSQSQRINLASEDKAGLWTDLATLLAAGQIPASFHDSLLYSAARVTPRAAVEPDLEAAKKSSPASILSDAAMTATRASLPSYTASQLMTVFSAMASMRMPLTNVWLESFWEYSRTQLASCAPQLIVACVSGLAAIKATPPRVWEQALLARLNMSATQFSLQDLNSLLGNLAACGIRPAPSTLETLLSSALTQLQEATARLETIQQMNGSTNQQAVGAEEEVVVASTRSSRRRSSTAGTASDSNQQSNVGTASENISAMRAAAVTCSQQSAQLLHLLELAIQVCGYQPAPTWLAQLQDCVSPAANSPFVPAEQRTALAQRLQKALLLSS